MTKTNTALKEIPDTNKHLSLMELTESVAKLIEIEKTISWNVENFLQNRDQWLPVRESVQVLHRMNVHRDKYYCYSDDASVYRSGLKAEARVIDQAKTLLEEEESLTHYETNLLVALRDSPNKQASVIEEMMIHYGKDSDEIIRNNILNYYPSCFGKITTQMIPSLFDHLKFLSESINHFSEDFVVKYSDALDYKVLHVNVTDLNIRQQRFMFKMIGVSKCWDYDNCALNIDEPTHQLLTSMFNAFLSDDALRTSITAVDALRSVSHFKNMVFESMYLNEPLYIFEKLKKEYYDAGTKIYKQFESLGKFCKINVLERDFYGNLDRRVKDIIQHDEDLNKTKSVGEYKSYEDFDKIYQKKLSDKNYFAAMAYDENVKALLATKLNLWVLSIPMNDRYFHFRILEEEKERG